MVTKSAVQTNLDNKIQDDLLNKLTDKIYENIKDNIIDIYELNNENKKLSEHTTQDVNATINLLLKAAKDGIVKNASMISKIGEHTSGEKMIKERQNLLENNFENLIEKNILSIENKVEKQKKISVLILQAIQSLTEQEISVIVVGGDSPLQLSTGKDSDLLGFDSENLNLLFGLKDGRIDPSIASKNTNVKELLKASKNNSLEYEKIIDSIDSTYIRILARIDAESKRGPREDGLKNILRYYQNQKDIISYSFFQLGDMRESYVLLLFNRHTKEVFNTFQNPYKAEENYEEYNYDTYKFLKEKGNPEEDIKIKFFIENPIYGVASVGNRSGLLIDDIFITDLTSYSQALINLLATGPEDKQYFNISIKSFEKADVAGSVRFLNSLTTTLKKIQERWNNKISKIKSSKSKEMGLEKLEETVKRQIRATLKNSLLGSSGGKGNTQKIRSGKEIQDYCNQVAIDSVQKTLKQE